MWEKHDCALSEFLESLLSQRLRSEILGDNVPAARFEPVGS